MEYPELDPDESIILQSRNVKFKSLSFDVVLTGRRIHLTGNKNKIIPPQDIILATLRNIETGENAIRDHFLILSLITDAGEKHQVVLTFAKQAGVERKRECNEWAKKLRSLIPPTTPVIVPSAAPELDKEHLVQRRGPTSIHEAEVSTRPARKKIEIASTSRTIPEKSPGDTTTRKPTSFPSSTIFCSRCGNRVPTGTPYCNRCGAPIMLPSSSGHEPQPAESASPVPGSFRAPEPVVTKVEGTVQSPAPEPVSVKVRETVQSPVPQPVSVKVLETVQSPVPQPVSVKDPETVQSPAPEPVSVKGEKMVQFPVDSTETHQGSPIEQIVLPIKPLIEESAPLVTQYPPVVQPASPSLTEPSLPVSYAETSSEGELPGFPGAEFSAVPSKEAAPEVPESPPPPLIPASGGKKSNYRAIGILILAILPILVGLVIVGNIILGPSGGPANTTQAVPAATTSHPQLPQTQPPSITVMSPDGGDTWQRGTSQTITWSYTGSPGSMVKIVLLKEGIEVGTIMDSTSAGSDGTGSTSWPIALSGTTGGDYTVSVQSISQPAIKDESNNYFTLTPATTTSDTTTSDPVRTENSTEVKKGQLNVTIGNYSSELPVFIDNKSAGVVSGSRPLNLTPNVGHHTVRVCVIGLCNNQDVIVVSSRSTEVDFGDWLTNDVVTGPLTVSIGGFNAELPILVDNQTVGNVSMGKPLNLMVSEGYHFVKVCVGILCTNETVDVKFARPVNIDFGERLKNIAEFPTPTVRIVDTRQDGAKVTVDLEFINPTKNDITFTTTVQCAYSYIDAQTRYRLGNAKQITVTRSVKAGTRSKQSSDIWLSGGRSYIIEIPQILNVTTSL